MRHRESDLQRACVSWFRLSYPKYARLFFAVPNGGFRNSREALRMKEEGVLPGVSDLVILVPNSHFHALCIEMKTERGRLSKNQIIFRDNAERLGYRYAVCRSLEEFCTVVEEYFGDG